MHPFNIIEFKSIDSTNVYAKNNFHDLKHFDVVQAHHQTHGKGRMERAWISPNSQNLYCSIIIKDTIDPQKIPNITQMTSLCIVRMLKDFQLNPFIKWPNDVLIGSKKISGILSETVLDQNQMTGIIIGIGLNVNMPEDLIREIDQPATSMNIELNEQVLLNQVFKKLLQQFSDIYPLYYEKGFIAFKSEWLSYCPLIGKKIRLSNHGQNVQIGNIVDICDDGSLMIQFKNESKRIYSGDISIIKS